MHIVNVQIIFGDSDRRVPRLKRTERARRVTDSYNRRRRYVLSRRRETCWDVWFVRDSNEPRLLLMTAALSFAPLRPDGARCLLRRYGKTARVIRVLCARVRRSRTTRLLRGAIRFALFRLGLFWSRWPFGIFTIGRWETLRQITNTFLLTTRTAHACRV